MGKLATLSGTPPQISETVFIGDSGQQRTDRGTTSTIIDLNKKHLITLDHTNKKWRKVTFQQMREQMEAIKKMGIRTPAAKSREGSGAQDVKVDASIEPTGETETIQGIQARRVIMTLNMKGERGSMVLVSDVWTGEIEGYENVRAFQQKMAREMGDIHLGVAGSRGIQGAVLRNPHMQELMKKAETAELEGTPLRATTHMVQLPEGQEYNPDLVFNEEQEKQEEQETGQENKEPKEGLAGLLQGALGGAMGSGAASNKQSTMFKNTTRLSNLVVGPLDSDLFVPPSNYSQQDD